MRRPLIGIVVAVLLAHLPAGLLAAQVRLPPGVTVASLEQAVARDSNDPGLQYDLALGYWSEGRWDDAQRALELSRAIEPRNAPALLALSELPFARRPQLQHEIDTGTVPPEWQIALVLSDRYSSLAFQIDPLVDHRIIGAARPAEPRIPRDADPRMRALLVGLAMFRSGQYDQTFAWFDRFAQQQGEGTDSARVPGFVYLYRGISAAHLNDFPSALRDLRKLHAADERDEIAIFFTDPVLNTYLLAWFEQRAGHFGRASELYREALTRDLGLWMAHVQLARIHDERSEFPEAIRERRLALQVNPDDPGLQLDLGIELYKGERYEEAATVLAQAQAGLPRNFRVPYYQGVVAVQRGDSGAAREAFTRSLALVPSRYTIEVAEVRRRLRALD